jgi:hypothetical protein
MAQNKVMLDTLGIPELAFPAPAPAARPRGRPRSADTTNKRSQSNHRCYERNKAKRKATKQVQKIMQTLKETLGGRAKTEELLQYIQSTGTQTDANRANNLRVAENAKDLVKTLHVAGRSRGEHRAHVLAQLGNGVPQKFLVDEMGATPSQASMSKRKKVRTRASESSFMTSNYKSGTARVMITPAVYAAITTHIERRTFVMSGSKSDVRCLSMGKADVYDDFRETYGELILDQWKLDPKMRATAKERVAGKMTVLQKNLEKLLVDSEARHKKWQRITVTLTRYWPILRALPFSHPFLLRVRRPRTRSRGPCDCTHTVRCSGSSPRRRPMHSLSGLPPRWPRPHSRASAHSHLYSYAYTHTRTLTLPLTLMSRSHT